MARKIFIPSDQYPYHVNARVNNKERFPIDLKQMWDIISFECLVMQQLYEIQIHALVLMPNHFHMIVSTPNPKYNLATVMSCFLSAITKSCHKKSGRSGRLFGGRYHGTLITSSRYYGHVLKYVYRNPVRANLCSLVEDYEFSTLRGLIGIDHLAIPIHLTNCALEMNIPDPDNRLEWVKWLNGPFLKEHEALIQKALRKKEINYLICSSSRRKIAELEQLL